MEKNTVNALMEIGFIEIAKEQIRTRNFKELIEYWDGKTWRDFAKK